MTVKVSLEELIKAGAHFGHQSKRWNPKMAPFVYGEKEGVHIFDLVKTKEKLEEALEVIKKASKEGKKILLVGTKKQAKEIVKKVAQETEVFWVTERWLGGTLTNFDQMRKSTKKLGDMKSKMEAGEFKDRTKKERLLLAREIDRLERFFGGVVGMDNIPELIFIVDIKRETGALQEAVKKGVEVVGVVDTNSDPTLVDYPIPMNDDATRAIEYVLELVRDAILEGKEKKSKVSLKSKKEEK